MTNGPETGKDPEKEVDAAKVNEPEAVVASTEEPVVKSIEELSPELQAELKIIERDPTNFLQNFELEHIKNGTDSLPESEKHALEAKALAQKYLNLQAMCEAEGAPAEAFDKIDLAIATALNKRGIDIENIAQIKEIARGGERPDLALGYIGSERLRNELAALFDADGDMRDSLGLEELFKVLGVKDGSADILKKFDSIEAFSEWLSRKYELRERELESVLDCAGLEADKRDSAYKTLNNGLLNAIGMLYEVAAKSGIEASVRPEESPKPEAESKPVESAKPTETPEAGTESPAPEKPSRIKNFFKRLKEFGADFGKAALKTGIGLGIFAAGAFMASVASPGLVVLGTAIYIGGAIYGIGGGWGMLKSIFGAITR